MRPDFEKPRKPKSRVYIARSPRRISVPPKQPNGVARKVLEPAPRKFNGRSSDRWINGSASMLRRLRRVERTRLSTAYVTGRLSAIELGIVIVSAYIAKLAYLDLFRGYWQPTFDYLALALVLGPILHLTYRELQLYDPDAIRGRSIEIGKLLGGLAIAFLLLLGCLYLFKITEFYSRLWMLSWFVLCAAALCAIRIAVRRFIHKAIADGRMREYAAIYGTPEFAQETAVRLQSCGSEINVAGTYIDDWSAPNHTLSNKVGLKTLAETAQHGFFSQIIIALPTSEAKSVRKVIDYLAHLPVELQLYTDSATIPVLTRYSRRVGSGQLHVVMPIPLSERAQVVKSTLDFILAAIALIVLSPVLLLTALAIKAEDGGPVFFRQRRCGRHQNVFSIYKFRTMRVAEDGPIIRQAERGDVRVTRVGRILRCTSLDELPQLINVVKGEMSIVGPRPHALAHEKKFGRKIEYFSWRHRVKPGITGWAQVNGLRGETRTNEQMRMRMEHDLYYIENWSVWLDLEIMLRTLPTVLSGRGAF